MADTIRVVDYYCTTTPDKPGEGAQQLRALRDARVNLLALSAFPSQRKTQVDFVPLGLRRWWLGAAATALADRALTFGYFVPAMVRPMRAENSPAAVSAAIQWTQLNHLRHAIVLAALLAALKAFSLLYAHRGRVGGLRGASS